MSESISEKLLRSKKYGKLCPETIMRVCDESISRYKKASDAEHAAREALHGITCAFMTGNDRKHCMESLRSYLETGDRTDLEAALSRHASTAERLPLERTDAIFDRLLTGVRSDAVILDLACGIDPIYLAARGLNAVGTDISGEAVELINAAGESEKMHCRAECRDLLGADPVPGGAYGIILLFKVLPLLERQRKGSARALLDRLEAPRIIVSFPTRTLSGRNVGMEAHYAQWMEENLPQGRKIADTFAEGNELFYVLTRGS